jgi:hypothetical protein
MLIDYIRKERIICYILYYIFMIENKTLSLTAIGPRIGPSLDPGELVLIKT